MHPNRLKPSLGMVAAVAAAAALLGSPRGALATKQQAKSRAADAAAVIEGKGFVCRNEIEMRELEQGEHMWINTTLYSSHEYVIIGAGDSGIDDLDLEIYDRNYSLVASDHDEDPVPIVQVKPLRSSVRAHLKVIAYRGSGWTTAIICHRRG